MKNIQTKHKSKKILIITLVIIVMLLVSATIFYLNYYKPSQSSVVNPPNTVDYSPATKSQDSNGDSVKQASADGTSNTDKPTNPTPKTNSALSTVAIHLTSANQNGNIYQLRFQIDTSTNTGSCELTLTNNDTSSTYNAGVQANNNISTCQGFDIPIDSTHLTPGTWQVNLSFQNDALSGMLSSEIQVQ